MYFVYQLICFILGTIIGSFLNVVILRHQKEERVGGRSYCPSCHKQLHWYELVPVLSYVVQRGHCRGCGALISAQYPLVEFLTGLVFVAVWSLVGTYPWVLGIHTLLPLVLAWGVWALLIVITVYDLRTMLIPDHFSFSFAGLALLSSFVSEGFVWQTLIAGPLLFLPFYALWKYSDGRWMGLGDGKLAWGIGWYLGLMQGASAIMFAFWLGAVGSLALIGAQRLVQNVRTGEVSFGLSSEVPFGPYLVAGIGIVYFLGYTLLDVVR
jgi:leader peptidase (prepilin peptidase) / N-methyltransferase